MEEFTLSTPAFVVAMAIGIAAGLAPRHAYWTERVALIVLCCSFSLAVASAATVTVSR